MNNHQYLLPHLFLKTVYQNKTKTALIIDDDYYSYWLIYEDCLRFVECIGLKSKKTNGRVIIIGGNNYITVVAFWATILLGFVPCVIDPEMNEQTLSAVIEKIDPCIVVFENITDSRFKLISDFGVDLISGVCERIHKNINCNFKYSATESDLAMIMHTSGSTGAPKGVMLSHRNIISAVESISNYLSMNSCDVILSVLPMHFDYGLYQMLLAFHVGGTLILEKNLLFPNLVANKISKYKVSVLPCVPLMVQLFHLTSKRFSYDFSSLRIVTNTGENLSPSHIEKIKKIFPKAVLFSMYGLTECKRCSYLPPDMLEKKPGSIGIPIPNLKMWIQGDNGDPVGHNIEGNLVISGPTVMIGYWRDSVETQKKLTLDDNGQKILLTGDRAIMDDEGYFYFRGRNDHVIKYKGIKFDCFEYAEILMKLKHVNRSYIFTEAKNVQEQVLVVCIESDLTNNNMDLFKKAIFEKFPSKQKPDCIYFSDRFPSLSNGKLNKKMLEKTALENTWICTR
ncbi:MAG: class I adenylate-forming enzyme family protein [Gammaproteobacteria bacterium]|nr:class I adenylate-forming enzyme family protein [Gammaproteobacteria bacterium]